MAAQSYYSARAVAADLGIRLQRALALLLAAGLYGTLANAAARRTREIGERLVLGAQREAVVRLVLGESLLPVAGGMLAGVPLSLAAGYSLRAFLFELTPHDIPAFVGACVVLTVMAVLAAFVPARRASRVDPIVVLKMRMNRRSGAKFRAGWEVTLTANVRNMANRRRQKGIAKGERSLRNTLWALSKSFNPGTNLT